MPFEAVVIWTLAAFIGWALYVSKKYPPDLSAAMPYGEQLRHLFPGSAIIILVFIVLSVIAGLPWWVGLAALPFSFFVLYGRMRMWSSLHNQPRITLRQLTLLLLGKYED